MQGLAPKPCRTMDSLSLRVIIPDFPVLSFKYVHILHAYAYVLKVPFHVIIEDVHWPPPMGSCAANSYATEGFWGRERGGSSLQVRRRVHFSPVPLLTHRCVALGGTYIPGIASTVPYPPFCNFVLSLKKRTWGYQEHSCVIVIHYSLCNLYYCSIFLFSL